MDELKQIFSLLSKNQVTEETEGYVKVSFKGRVIKVTKESLNEGIGLFFTGFSIEGLSNEEEELQLEEIALSFQRIKTGLPNKKEKRFIKQRPEGNKQIDKDDILGDLVKITSNESVVGPKFIAEKPKRNFKNLYISGVLAGVILIIFLVLKPNNKQLNEINTPTTSKQEKVKFPTKKVLNKNIKPAKVSSPKKNRSQRSRFRLQAKDIPTPSKNPTKRRLPSSSPNKKLSDNKRIDNELQVSRSSNELDEVADNEYEENDPYENEQYDQIPQPDYAVREELIEPNIEPEPEEIYSDEPEREDITADDYKDTYAEDDPYNEEPPAIEPY